MKNQGPLANSQRKAEEVIVISDEIWRTVEIDIDAIRESELTAVRRLSAEGAFGIVGGRDCC